MAAEPHRPAAPLLLAGTLLFASIVGACASDPPDPATARRGRVETRLRATYSAAQARCVLGRLDARTLAVLDRRDDVAPSRAEFQRYSDALRACVVPDATTTTTAAVTTTAGG